MFTKSKIDELKSCLTDYVSSITEPSKGANMYVCPLCGSGLGSNRTGAFKLYADGEKSSWYCHKWAKGGDIFDLIGEYENIGNVEQRMKRAAELYDLRFDDDHTFKTSAKPKNA